MSGDSAGQPWAGRSFESNSWSGDDGSAPAGYRDAVGALHARTGSAVAVVDVLREARLLMPLIASLAEAGTGEHGLLVEKKSELALPTVAGPDGRAVLPAFSSMDAMRAWNAAARPIPTPARQVALGAAADRTELVVIDPGSARPFALRRGAVEALARDLSWTPSWTDTAVLDAITAGASRERAIARMQIEPGDPLCMLAAAELQVTLFVRGTLDRGALSEMLGRVQPRWSGNAVIAARVDSLAVRIREQ